MCGRTKTEVFQYEDVIHQSFTTSITHALLGMLSFPSFFKRFPVDVRNQFKYASCGRVLLKAEKRNFLFQEYPVYMQTGALIFCDGEFIFSIPIYIGKAAL